MRKVGFRWTLHLEFRVRIQGHQAFTAVLNVLVLRLLRGVNTGQTRQQTWDGHLK